MLRQRKSFSPTSLHLVPALLAALVGTSCESEPELVNETPVRASLDDGQVLMGGVRTQVLELVTGFGTVEVPLAHVGEVRPVEGGALGGSGNHVSLWLRNGSELRGEWAEPELEMALEIAGELVSVDLPMDQLERFQLQGGDLMPRGEVFRIKTVFGDDFVVDAQETWVSLSNDLGRFEPTLAEVSSLERGRVASLAEGEGGSADDEWIMVLDSGSVLHGSLEGVGEDLAELELVLPLGPELVTVPLDSVVSIERQDWGHYDSYRDAIEIPEQQGLDSGLWFDNARQSGFKKTL